MQQIIPSISQIEVLLQEYQTQYADKNNMPLDWVSQYKTFQSHNITLENWNTFNLYIHNILSDTKSSHEFTVSSMNLLFDTFKTLDANDKEHTLHIEELQAYVDLHKDIFNSGVIYLQNITEGSAALSSLKENQKVLSIKHRSSTYVGGKSVEALQMFIVTNGKYQSIYSVEIDYHDLIVKHESLLDTHSKLLTSLQNKVDSLDITNIVRPSDISDVAFSGNYNDLSNKPNIPTQLSELTNNEGFITNAVSDLINYYKKTETFTKDEITAKLNAIKTIKFEIYASLDSITEPQANVIYLVGTQSPYDEYAYIEDVGFELIGSSAIDLSSYVQTSDTLNTNKLVVGNGEKNIKTTDYTVKDYGTSGIMLNSDTDIPTSKLVLNEISKYHAFFTINGDSGNLGATTIASASDYKLIIDENLLVYRRISKQTGNIVYHSQEVIDGTHIRDYYLTFNANGDYVRTFVENVSHAEFDDLVVSTPTDIAYNSETKVAQLTHDGQPVGEGTVIDLNGFIPYFEDDTLVLTELGAPTFIDKNFLTVGLYLKRPIQNPKFLVSYAGLNSRGKFLMPSHNAKRINRILRYDMPSELNNDNFMDTLHNSVKHIFGNYFADHTVLKKATFSRPNFKFDASANIRKERSYNTVQYMGSDYMKSKAYILHNNGAGISADITDKGRVESFQCPNSVNKYISGRWLKDNVSMGVITMKLVENFEEQVVNAAKGTTKWVGNMAKNCIKLMFQLDNTKGKLYVLYTFKVEQL